MAERVVVPPSDEIPENHNPIAIQTGLNFKSGTYVVQVPRDQVYRVPHPENAHIAKSRPKPEPKKKNSYCWCCCIVVVIIMIIVIGLGIGLLIFFLQPKNPKFQVQRVVVKSTLGQNNHSRPDYNFTLKVQNPHRMSSILYKQDGVTSLSFKQQKIATGKFPTFHQDHQKSTEIGVVLKGSNTALPKDVQNTMTGTKPKASVSLSLEMNVPARMRISVFKMGNAKLVITCDFKVDTLAKGTRILSQECHTHR